MNVTEDEKSNRPCQTPQSILKVKKLIQTDEKNGSASKQKNLGEDFEFPDLQKSQKVSVRSESRNSRESTPGKSLRFNVPKR